MGEAVEPPAITRFGASNLEATGPAIDLVSQDDLPAAEKLNTDDDWIYPYPTDFVIQEKPIDEIKSLKASSPCERLATMLLTITGGCYWSWHCRNHCWSSASDQGPRHSIDYLR